MEALLAAAAAEETPPPPAKTTTESYAKSNESFAASSHPILTRQERRQQAAAQRPASSSSEARRMARRPPAPPPPAVRAGCWLAAALIRCADACCSSSASSGPVATVQWLRGVVAPRRCCWCCWCWGGFWWPLSVVMPSNRSLFSSLPMTMASPTSSTTQRCMATTRTSFTPPIWMRSPPRAAGWRTTTSSPSAPRPAPPSCTLADHLGCCFPSPASLLALPH
jgi:hypothetical protein